MYDVISKYFDCVIDESDRKLIKIIFSNNPTQSDLDKFLEDWDIEAEGSQKALLLSYFMKAHPELSFPTYVGPRLNGLIKYYRFQNVNLISHFSKLVKEYKKTGADIMIIKGGAMRHLRPDYPRIMSDMDIVIDRKHFNLILDITKKLDGYKLSDAMHSVDIHYKSDNVLDVHRYIDFGYFDYISFKKRTSKSFTERLFNRATEQVVFGEKIKVPSYEDLVFIIIVNLVKNLGDKHSLQGALFNIFDIKFLISSKPDFNWNNVFSDVIETGMQVQYYVGQQFINKVVPGLIPDLKNKIDTKGNFDFNYKKFCILREYIDTFIVPLNEKKYHKYDKYKDPIKWQAVRWFCKFMKMPIYINSSLIERLILLLFKKKEK